MKVNLTPFSHENLIEVSRDNYYELVHNNEKGWSHCNSKIEFLAKLHYLRSGFHQDKINKDKFCELEKKLVVNYWNKGS